MLPHTLLQPILAAGAAVMKIKGPWKKWAPDVSSDPREVIVRANSTLDALAERADVLEKKLAERKKARTQKGKKAVCDEDAIAALREELSKQNARLRALESLDSLYAARLEEEAKAQETVDAVHRDYEDRMRLHNVYLLAKSAIFQPYFLAQKKALRDNEPIYSVDDLIGQFTSLNCARGFISPKMDEPCEGFPALIDGEDRIRIYRNASSTLKEQFRTLMIDYGKKPDKPDVASQLEKSRKKYVEWLKRRKDEVLTGKTYGKEDPPELVVDAERERYEKLDADGLEDLIKKVSSTSDIILLKQGATLSFRDLSPNNSSKEENSTIYFHGDLSQALSGISARVVAHEMLTDREDGPVAEFTHPDLVRSYKYVGKDHGEKYIDEEDGSAMLTFPERPVRVSPAAEENAQGRYVDQCEEKKLGEIPVGTAMRLDGEVGMRLGTYRLMHFDENDGKALPDAENRPIVHLFAAPSTKTSSLEEMAPDVFHLVHEGEKNRGMWKTKDSGNYVYYSDAEGKIGYQKLLQSLPQEIAGAEKIISLNMVSGQASSVSIGGMNFEVKAIVEGSGSMQGGSKKVDGTELLRMFEDGNWGFLAGKMSRIDPGDACRLSSGKKCNTFNMQEWVVENIVLTERGFKHRNKIVGDSAFSYFYKMMKHPNCFLSEKEMAPVLYKRVRAICDDATDEDILEYVRDVAKMDSGKKAAAVAVMRRLLQDIGSMKSDTDLPFGWHRAVSQDGKQYFWKVDDDDSIISQWEKPEEDDDSDSSSDDDDDEDEEDEEDEDEDDEEEEVDYASMVAEMEEMIRKGYEDFPCGAVKDWNDLLRKYKEYASRYRDYPGYEKIQAQIDAMAAKAKTCNDEKESFQKEQAELLKMLSDMKAWSDQQCDATEDWDTLFKQYKDAINGYRKKHPEQKKNMDKHLADLSTHIERCAAKKHMNATYETMKEFRTAECAKDAEEKMNVDRSIAFLNSNLKREYRPQIQAIENVFQDDIKRKKKRCFGQLEKELSLGFAVIKSEDVCDRNAGAIVSFVQNLTKAERSYPNEPTTKKMRKNFDDWMAKCSQKAENEKRRKELIEKVRRTWPDAKKEGCKEMPTGKLASVIGYLVELKKNFPEDPEAVALQKEYDEWKAQCDEKLRKIAEQRRLKEEKASRIFDEIEKMENEIIRMSCDQNVLEFYVAIEVFNERVRDHASISNVFEMKRNNAQNRVINKMKSCKDMISRAIEKSVEKFMADCSLSDEQVTVERRKLTKMLAYHDRLQNLSADEKKQQERLVGMIEKYAEECRKRKVIDDMRMEAEKKEEALFEKFKSLHAEILLIDCASKIQELYEGMARLEVLAKDHKNLSKDFSIAEDRAKKVQDMWNTLRRSKIIRCKWKITDAIDKMVQEFMADCSLSAEQVTMEQRRLRKILMHHDYFHDLSEDEKKKEVISLNERIGKHAEECRKRKIQEEARAKAEEKLGEMFKEIESAYEELNSAECTSNIVKLYENMARLEVLVKEHNDIAKTKNVAKENAKKAQEMLEKMSRKNRITCKSEIFYAIRKMVNDFMANCTLTDEEITEEKRKITEMFELYDRNYSDSLKNYEKKNVMDLKNLVAEYAEKCRKRRAEEMRESRKLKKAKKAFEKIKDVYSQLKIVKCTDNIRRFYKNMDELDILIDEFRLVAFEHEMAAEYDQAEKMRDEIVEKMRGCKDEIMESIRQGFDEYMADCVFDRVGSEKKRKEGFKKQFEYHERRQKLTREEENELYTMTDRIDNKRKECKERKIAKMKLQRAEQQAATLLKKFQKAYEELKAMDCAQDVVKFYDALDGLKILAEDHQESVAKDEEKEKVQKMRQEVEDRKVSCKPKIDATIKQTFDDFMADCSSNDDSRPENRKRERFIRAITLHERHQSLSQKETKALHAMGGRIKERKKKCIEKKIAEMRRQREEEMRLKATCFFPHAPFNQKTGMHFLRTADMGKVFSAVRSMAQGRLHFHMQVDGVKVTLCEIRKAAHVLKRGAPIIVAGDQTFAKQLGEAIPSVARTLEGGSAPPLADTSSMMDTGSYVWSMRGGAQVAETSSSDAQSSSFSGDLIHLDELSTVNKTATRESSTLPSIRIDLSSRKETPLFESFW